MKQKVIFNVLAKDVDNAKELADLAGDRVLIGIMVKNYPSVEAAIEQVELYKDNKIPVSVGLGAGDPAMWKMVADVSAKTMPNHVNQVFPAAGYTLGRIHELGAVNTLVNALIEPSGSPGEVYISTGPSSSRFKEKVSCEMAATMLAELGVDSVKFYPIDGDRRLDEVAAMVKAAVNAGLAIFEPTGGIDVENVQRIVQTCLDHGAETVIPHLYTSLIDQETGKTEVEKMKQLLRLEWN
ncbi:4-hydroxy-2-ketovalerate aldolase [Robertmurraya siralis]|uniref:4-hydroxy-2-ketovalerate aldolase n=1 Tax=Robertmurraya siralis TaxID=77777 RepID=A0A919WJ26_9BACI|nr:KDGP aldolase [Robertmurraya siralis]GIN62609.1 4-hydroxy-2-ketovalerate aldolase [Robertmurraya siralis]